MKILDSIAHLFKKRLSICKENKCGQYRDLGLIKQCGACGCILNIKARMPSMDCPLKMWPQKQDESKGKCGGCR